jgi:uncharacterized protein YbjT (DUF2867 family)
MRAKVAQETLIRSAGRPFTILRATQFLEFIAAIVAQFPTEGQTVRVPSAYFQPVLADEVVAALVEVVLGPPANGIIDLAGPTRFHFDDIVRQFLKATRDARQVVPDERARYFGAQLVADALVPLGESRVGTTRFEDWLTYSTAKG